MPQESVNDGCRRRRLAFAASIGVALAGAGLCAAECPPAEAVLARMKALDLTGVARSQEFELEPPETLYRKAAENPGKPVSERDGKLGQAVVVVPQAIAPLWMAINDEDHYAEGDYLPIRHSQVVDGASRGQRRLLFQYAKRAGMGRWWIDEVEMSHELYVASGGMLWELRWRDLMETHGEESLPEGFADLGLAPIRESRGAWLMVPISDSCTLVEYVTFSNPGGFLNVAQWFAAGHMIRETLEGIQRLAREHIPEPHPEARFVRPDGTAISTGESAE